MPRTHGSRLLTRELFRERVFARDKNKCVLCGEPAADPHHILERRLFPDGGYYLDNGASVCARCHLKCERCEISVEDIRAAAAIKITMLPPGFLPEKIYDKWGNEIMPDGSKIAGPLGDEGLRKATGIAAE